MLGSIIAQIVSSIFYLLIQLIYCQILLVISLISILISSVILLLIYGFKLRSKFQKVIDIDNKISRAFIVSVFFGLFIPF